MTKRKKYKQSFSANKSIPLQVSPTPIHRKKPNGKITNGLGNGLNLGKNSRSFETRFEPRYKVIPPLPKGLPKSSFSEAANKILIERYLLKGGNLETVETVSERFWHIAYDIASADFDFGSKRKDVMDSAKTFYSMMVRQEFLPNSPTIMNAGKQNGLQYSACFVLPVGDSITEIFDAIKYAALIHQSGGGTGFAFSRLRPNGSVVKTTGGVASGPVSFLRVFNAATESIKQGGTRRGANMGILRVDHPDILEFIRCKAELDDLNRPVYERVAPLLDSDEAREQFKRALLSNQIANFNISVAVTDEFMEAYYKGRDYKLIDPITKKVVGKLNAKKVFNEIIERAWHTGDPGVVFIDRINHSPANPVPSLEEIEATNPCVTADTWVHTNEGARQVYELIRKSFTARVSGKHYLTTADGFYKTGEKQVYSLQTKEGYSLRLTDGHKVNKVKKLTRYALQTEWVEVKNLKTGDRVLLNNHRTNTEWVGKYSFTEGYLMGLLIGDGTLKKDKAVLSVWQPSTSGSGAVMSEVSQLFHKFFPETNLANWMEVAGRDEHRFSRAQIKRLANEMGMYPGEKVITSIMEQGSSDFYRGLLRGLFDTDGSIQGTQSKGVSVRLAQSDLSCLRTVQRMLLRLGIASCIYQNRRLEGFKELPNGKGGNSKYHTKAQHELVISGDNLLIFQELMGFKDSTKRARLQKLLKNYKRILNRERFVATVEEIELASVEDVYDVQIPGINAFDANGLYVHNCGEQPLAPNDACNLGSINLGKFVLADGSGVDWDALRKATRTSVHFLDNVVQTNPFTLKQIYEEVHRNRRIGLGVMGWADMLFKLGIIYNSNEAIELGEQVMKFINDEGHLASEDLAALRGPFPNWPYSIYKNGKPLRNSTVTTIAPTGTISIIGDCSSGIEPVFALAYLHKAKTRGDQVRTLTIANQTFAEIGKKEGFYSDSLAEKVMEKGTVSGLSDVSSKWQKVFVTAQEIEPNWHVRMQAAFQKGTDNGVSKTINLPNSATREDVKSSYLLAWETGCSGITIYRDGSKATQVLNISSNLDKSGKVREVTAVEINESQDTVVHRPMTLRGRTYKVLTPVGEAFITINRDEGDQPFEVFVTIGKAGMQTSADAEALGRLVSLSLRIARSENRQEEIAKKIVAQLRGIGGSSQTGFGKERVMSLADAIGKALAEDLALYPQNPEVVPLNLTPQNSGKDDVAVGKQLLIDPSLGADLCPECGNATFVFEEGCKKCHSCGYSMC